VFRNIGSLGLAYLGVGLGAWGLRAKLDRDLQTLRAREHQCDEMVNFAWRLQHIICQESNVGG